MSKPVRKVQPKVRPDPRVNPEAVKWMTEMKREDLPDVRIISRR